MTNLGYPEYVMTILGTWKLLGGLAVLAPGLPRVKEWAYAGMAFDLTGAALSHAAAGHPAPKVVVSLLILAVVVEPFGLTQPTISKHLKVLERAGLVSREGGRARRTATTARVTSHRTVAPPRCS